MKCNKKRTYIIAEMACSHEGNPLLAKKIIKSATKAQADAIQFQIWSLPDMVVPHHPDYRMLEKIELSRQNWTDLAQYVRDNSQNMEIIACVYEQKSVDFAESINVDAYKIHSADLSNPDLIKFVAQTGKRIDLSVGASTIDEIQKAIEWIKNSSSSEIWLMYGYQNFPTPTDKINLSYMLKLKQLFELPMGYQDHSDADTNGAFWLPAAALGMGINILEKHITHDWSLKGIDHQAALNPDEFTRFVAMIREIETAKGISIPHSFSADELKYRKYSKKSIVSKTYLPSGTKLTKDKLLFMRTPELGLPPDQINSILNKQTNRDIQPYQLIQENDVQ